MPSTQLADREYYHELTTKQKAIIDAYAENPEGGYTTIANAASEKLGESVSRSYTRPVLDHYADIAEQQRQKKENGRYQGEERTEPATLAELMDSKRETTASSEGRTLEVDLTADDVRELLSGNVTEELQQELIDSLIQTLR